MIRRGSSVTLLLILFAATLARAAAIEVDARLEPTLVGVGQFATLTVEARVEGGIDLALEPRFSLDNLEIVAGPTQSQQVSFVNGRVSRSQTLSWTLRALEVGAARVRELRLEVNQEVFELPEQALEVQEEPVEQVDPFGRIRRFADPFEDFFDPMRRRQVATAAEPKLFLRAEARPRNPYVGQQVLYSLLLFTQADIGAVSPDKIPDFEGLWAVDIEQPQRPKSVMTEVQGERYGRVVLLQKALFPLRPGQLQLDPVEARLVAKIPDSSWLGMATRYDKEFSLTSNAITLDVRALPEAPAGFRGAVGEFDLDVILNPREIELGEAATLTLQLSGRGNVEALPGPDLPELDGVKVFPPQRGGGGHAAGTTVRGDRTWTYVLVPEESGAWEITIPEYWYFDPDKGAYARTDVQTRVLVARRADQPPLIADETATIGGNESQPAREDPPPGPTSTTSIRSRVKPLLLAGSVLLVLALAAPLARRAGERRKTRVSLRRHLKAAADLEKPRLAAQAIEAAWREFFSERWSFSSSLSPSEWPARLTACGVTPETAAEVTRLIDDLHYLRYAPELSAYEDLRRDLVERSMRLARELS
ncbi:MAG: BatD family protein [Acidobacteriota bacterium]|nr:BatD family protein [Acidobacteriota bacterium]